MTPAILLKSGVDARSLSAYSRGVMCDLLAKSGNPSALIASLGRSPAAQARAMFANLEKTGAKAGRDLYGPSGDKVIDTYEQSKTDGNTSGDIVQDMTDTIIAVGPERVSDHCADQRVRQVIDVSRGKLLNADAFVSAAKADPRMSKVLDELRNGCVHLVIPQRQRP